MLLTLLLLLAAPDNAVVMPSEEDTTCDAPACNTVEMPAEEAIPAQDLAAAVNNEEAKRLADIASIKGISDFLDDKFQGTSPAVWSSQDAEQAEVLWSNRGLLYLECSVQAQRYAASGADAPDLSAKIAVLSCVEEERAMERALGYHLLKTEPSTSFNTARTMMSKFRRDAQEQAKRYILKHR